MNDGPKEKTTLFTSNNTEVRLSDGDGLTIVHKKLKLMLQSNWDTETEVLVVTHTIYKQRVGKIIM